MQGRAAMGLCAQEDPSRLLAHLAAMGMKKDLADIDGALPGAGGLMALMGQDKKVHQGRLTFILARGIGEAFVERDVDLRVVKGGCWRRGCGDARVCKLAEWIPRKTSRFAA
jgi:3-dehydroquinate synthase